MVSCPLLPLSVGTDTPGRRRRPLSTLTSSVNLASSGEPLYRRKVYRLPTVKKERSSARVFTKNHLQGIDNL